MPNTEVTYRAVHVVGPGKLELTRKPLADPQYGYVRIRVEACGVCHTDATRWFCISNRGMSPGFAA
jgi:alcohol dehydrogenase, propanol-preferring